MVGVVCRLAATIKAVAFSILMILTLATVLAKAPLQELLVAPACPATCEIRVGSAGFAVNQ